MKKPFLIGLTGSIGMGKTTTAKMFADEGVPVWDADKAVHQMYSRGGAAVAPISKVYPRAINDGQIDRDTLKDWILQDPTALKTIEAIVHPLVAKDRSEFIAKTSAEIVVLDIPLLYETGNDVSVDAVVVVSTSAETQRRRVIKRGTMTAQQFETILAKQVPDSEKRKRADYVIETETLAGAETQVRTVLSKIRERLRNA